MNDDYDNARTDREMLNKLASEPGDDGAEPAGDSVVAFTFPSVHMQGVDHLPSLARAASEVLRKRGHLGRFSVTITVACQDGEPGCEPQLWDDSPTSERTLEPPLELLLATYADGPRIWDATVMVPGVSELERLGLIEPVPGQGGAYQLTNAGRAELGDEST
jgi:hypothetical protein